MKKPQKKVYLVGAGPGDAGLLTIKGKLLLESAEVVVFDRLVSSEILGMIPATAEKINVGKNVSNHPVPQNRINEILLEKGKQGKLVVRLKGGDPFVFGRGGEELELLRDNNIPFEIVPGITSAIAAAAYAGIPVTHRDFCSSLHIITGHAKEGGELCIDFEALTRLNGTLVFMMSVGSIKAISDGLISAGMEGDTPVGVIENGTRLNQRSFVGTLLNIADIISDNKVMSPAAIIVGRVCSLSEGFDWFSELQGYEAKKPLHGCNVLVTRPQANNSRLAEQLLEAGAAVTLYPCIRTQTVDFPLEIDGINGIAFTSAVGVECYFKKLEELSLDTRYLSGVKVFAVGSQTAAELKRYGIRADFIPSVFDGEHLARELLQNGLVKEGDRVAIYRARKASNELINILNSNGVKTLDVTVYETEYTQKEGIALDEFDYVTFTSASCVEGFLSSNEAVGISIGASTPTAICIGEQTKKATDRLGMKTVMADNATIDDMVKKLIELRRS